MSPTETIQPPPGTRRRYGGRLAGLAFWLTIAGLVGLNAWWLARDLRPLPELKHVADWVRAGRFEDAEHALREHLRRSPHHGEVLMLLARVRAARGDQLGGARLLQEGPDWWPDKPDARFLEGQLFLGLHRARDAEAAWTRCLRQDPLHPLSPRSWGFVQSARELLKLEAFEHRSEDARALAWRLYERQTTPADQENILRSSLETQVLSETTEAQRARYGRYMAADPDDWQARRALAGLELSLGRAEEALRLMEECVKISPNEPVVRRDLLTILLDQTFDRNQVRQKRFHDEIARLPAALADHPELAKFRGIDREQSGDLPGAAEAYRRALEAGVGDKESYYRLGMIESRLGQREQARRDVAHARRLNDAPPRLYPAFWNYLEATRKADPAARAEAIARLATICADLDWTREAEAWRRLIPAH